MPRKPDERIEQAKDLYLKDMKLVEIASQLNLPEGTVRRWKSTHKWDSERSDKNSERSVKKKGGQAGNKNAVGHGAPEQNKNAVKTGEFETLFFDTLSEEEQKVIALIEPDKEKLLLQEIQLLTVRERRMMQRIENLKKSGDDETVSEDKQKIPKGMTLVNYKSGIERGKITDLNEFEGILGQIQNIEDALTRVQARRQKAIETLHRFGYDDAKLELETMKFEFEMLKTDGSGEETGEDGFIEALNTSAREVWSDD